MIECEVCHNCYGSFRDHCPTCGNYPLLEMSLHCDIAEGNNLISKFYQIVAAKGCVRQYATHARVWIDFSRCDAESAFGLRL